MNFESNGRPSIAKALAEWVVALDPTADDPALAEVALRDTIAVGLAAREAIVDVASVRSEEGRWAVACHIIDFDDLPIHSTTHTSTLRMPVALAVGGGPRSCLAGAGHGADRDSLGLAAPLGRLARHHDRRCP